MNRTLVVAKKEIKELLRDRKTLVVGIAFALFFSIMHSLGLIRGSDSAAAISLDSSIFSLTAAIGFFMVYMSTSQIFLREKMDRVIETLMCAPLNLRQIWLGKVLAVTTLAYLLSLLTALVIVIISNILSESLLLPSVPILFHVLLVVLMFVAALAGLLGFVQFLLGMRENRILGFIIFIPAFTALYGSVYMIGTSFAISWTHVGILFGISALLLAVTAYLTRRLSKERIVTTIT